MNYPSREFDDAVASACHGTADEPCIEALGRLVAESDAALDAYVLRTQLHAALLTTTQHVSPAELDDLDPVAAAHGPTTGPRGSRTGRGLLAACTGAAACGLLLAVLAAPWLRGTHDAAGGGETVARTALVAPSPPAAAREIIGIFADFMAVNWVAADTAIGPGDPVRAGDRIELAGGSLRIDLESGASVRLVGPTIFEIESTLSAVLTMGRAEVTAATPESKGFTIRTRTGRIVDLGTEFVAESLPDGRCRVGVTSGAVRFHLANSADGQLLNAGDLMEVEPGRRQVVTRIERGDESVAFRFPSIDPPSAHDFADAARGHATIRCVRGALYENPRKGVASGPPEILVDGRGQSNPDSPAESLYFANGDAGHLVVDLGAAVLVTKVNVYSWHRCLNPGFPPDLRAAHRERAAQNYVLYGHCGDEAPTPADDPAASGWTLIARVNSDGFFGLTGIARPAQQASSVASARGAIGRFRHLLFVVQPTKGTGHDGTETDFGTFFGEIDVYAE